MTPPQPLTLLQSADLLGRYRYVELGLFAVLGRRGATAEQGAVATYLAGASRAHGFRAELVAARLPVSVGLPGIEASTRSPSTHVDDLLWAVAEEPDDAAVLAALCAVIYPAMTAAYTAHLARCTPAADPPVARMLGRLLADLTEVARAGSEVSTASPTVRLAAAAADLLGRAGGAFGPLLDPPPTPQSATPGVA
jgi:hypothetical protein